jgi:surfactin family lipopeptide synthetase A
MFPASVLDCLRNGRITLWKGVASLVAMIARSGNLAHANLPELRVLAFAGEPIHAADVRIWMEHLPSVRYLNAYGPTEATGVSVLHEVAAPIPADGAHVPIGRPRDGVEAYVVDENLQVTSPGDTGELILAGDCLALGYWMNEEETRRRFIPTPAGLTSSGQRRFYRTGDLVRQDLAGDLWFVGRTDDELKVSGYRLSSLAVADALRSCPGVTDAAVLLMEDDRSRVSILVGFICTHGSVIPAEVLSYLRSQIPPYLCPRKLFLVAEIPLNQRGKVERTGLAKIAAEAHVQFGGQRESA